MFTIVRSLHIGLPGQSLKTTIEYNLNKSRIVKEKGIAVSEAVFFVCLQGRTAYLFFPSLLYLKKITYIFIVNYYSVRSDTLTFSSGSY